MFANIVNYYWTSKKNTIFLLSNTTILLVPIRQR